MRLPGRSLQGRLAVRLALVYLVVTILAVGLLLFRAFDSAAALNNRELRLRATDIARAVSVDASGAVTLAMPPALAAAYAASEDGDLFVVRDRGGRIIAASPAAFGERVAQWPLASEEPNWFRLDDFGPRVQDYYGLSVAMRTQAGMVSITVAQADGAHAFVESIVADFLFETAWIFPLLLAISLIIAIVVIRAGVKPIMQISERAAAIGPWTTSIRLPETDLPSEVAPLVSAMNRALDRLEQGMVVQRQFTDNAAHELRTPLAIVTAALDTMGDSAEVVKLRADVARMNHLVARLLSVARLDAQPLDVSSKVDLNETARGVVEAMAPWAIAQNRHIALVQQKAPVFILGNAPAIEDALRNLVENAVTYAQAGHEVTVGVGEDGSVSVADDGPGVPVEDRERIFERFWRGPDARRDGAGLGLSIIAEIMKAHRGTVSVEDNPGGGALFKLSFMRVM